MLPCTLYAQTLTFRKDFAVSSTNRLDFTDNDGQPLKQGGVYNISLNVLSTGTRTGANYLAWYDGKVSQWNLRLVSTAGLTSNHPALEVVDNVIKIFTEHENIYRIRAFVSFYDTGNINSVPNMLGSSYQWQRNALNLHYLDGNVGIGTSNPSERLAVNGKIRAKEIMVEVANWPDYVFQPNYS
ncbi:hypothetical protein [Sphingobacterium hotanense]|uniref:hypothetical protein n=1 Tax=Sphingobacterium hotanense TaxID=649196 RepID=UPI0021A447A9|nr:hypothetical protein [Sphingobacterium hotanense]MCT1526912.1 hypothetical protein [Sphingobacterium hotanense]